MPACLSEEAEGCKHTEMPSTGDDAAEGYFLLILCLQTLLMPFAGVWRRLLRYSSPRKQISPFSVFSTAASETTFKPVPRSVSPPGWKHFSMQIPAPTGWHSA